MFVSSNFLISEGMGVGLREGKIAKHALFALQSLNKSAFGTHFGCPYFALRCAFLNSEGKIVEYRLCPHIGKMVFKELQRRSQLENYTVNDRRHI